MEEGLLPELGGGDADLLPTGTRSFVSACRYDRRFWGTIFNLFTVFPVLLFIATLGSGGVQSVFLILTIADLLGSVLVLWLVSRANRNAYEEAVALGTWHEGVFVFPTGDVVVRFNQFFQKAETNIDGSSLSQAKVTKRFAPMRCGECEFIQLHFIDMSGRPMLVEVCAEDMVDSAATIAEFINDTKRRQAGGAY